MTDDNNLAALRKVESLEATLRTLRADFEEYRRKSEGADSHMSWAISSLTGKLDKHREDEKNQYEQQIAMGNSLNQKILETQKAIHELSTELKEPMEVYKTAKYGVRATTLLVTVVRWAIPLGVALVIGYNAWQAKMLADLKTSLPAVPAVTRAAEDR